MRSVLVITPSPGQRGTQACYVALHVTSFKKGYSDDVDTRQRGYKTHILIMHALLNGSEWAKLYQTGLYTPRCYTNAQRLIGTHLRHVRGTKNWSEIALPAEGLSNYCP